MCISIYIYDYNNDCMCDILCRYMCVCDISGYFLLSVLSRSRPSHEPVWLLMEMVPPDCRKGNPQVPKFIHVSFIHAL